MTISKRRTSAHRRIQQLEGNELVVEAEQQSSPAAYIGVDVRPDLALVTATVVRGGVGNFDDDVITIDEARTACAMVWP